VAVLAEDSVVHQEVDVVEDAVVAVEEVIIN
jgi:hypothetical protein